MSSTPPVSVLPPTFEQHHDGFGTAYDVEISADNGGSSQVFKIKGSASVLVPWPAESLESRARRFVRVRCHGLFSLSDQCDEVTVTDWSAASLLEIALLNNSDWTGCMITVPGSWPLNPNHSARPLRFHKRFNLPLNRSAITKARLYVTSHGVYSAYMNGKTIGDHCLSPGCQSYHRRLHYQIYDVKHLLATSGSNSIEVEVAAGWFASAWTWAKKRFIYGQNLGVLAQLEVCFADSQTPWVMSTDDRWTVSASALVSSEIYDGEVYDQRLDARPRDETCFATRKSPIPVGRLISPDTPPVRVVGRIEPKAIFKSRSGNTIIVDFGQNFAGRVFVEITGWSPEDRECPLTKSSIVAEVLHTDMKRTGWFSCSNDDVNRLHENSLWGMKSNFLSVPTECPSRDERMGWTGDLNVFAPTANFMYDTAGMLRNWLDDLSADQMEESTYWRQGVVPLFVPNCLLRKDDSYAWDPMPNAVWGDAAVMVPWELYRTSGDNGFLLRQYESMVQYLEHGVSRGQDGLWDPEQWQFGDWLDPRAPQNDSGRGTTDGTFVADCFLVRSTQIVAEVAGLLGNAADSSRFEDMHRHLVQSWRNKYLSAAGFVVSDTATALSLALSFDLYLHSEDDVVRKQVTSRLSRIVRLNDFKITSGFVGTAFLPRALTQNGAVDIAYAMLFQKQYPSYLYPVTMGATTTWERWDSMLPDGSVNPGSMTSFNHHALGSIAHWLHADVGGLEAIEPGWKVFRVKPQPNKELTWAETIFESKYGRIELKWTLEGENFRMTLKMALEGLGIAANFIAVVDISVKVIDWCVRYAQDVSHAKDDKTRLTEEVTRLNLASENAQELLRGPHGSRLKASHALFRATVDSQSQLRRIENLLARGQVQNRASLEALKWPFRRNEVEAILQDLRRCTDAIYSGLEVDQTSIILDIDHRTALDRLPAANGASFDSHAEEHNPKCLPDTRVELLKHVCCWIDDPDSKTIFWLNGMAGTGKSTISRTVAQLRSQHGDLGASFFFQRGETDRGSLARFVPTLARQLALSIPGVASLIKNAIDADPAIIGKTVREQFDKLVHEPLSKLAKEASTSPSLVIVIDALDECERDADISLLIDILSHTKVHRPRLRIFLTSRPELPIRLGFSEVKGTYQDLILHEIPAQVVEHDISAFLADAFRKIRGGFNMTVGDERKLESSWPGEATLQDLTMMAVPLFIFAATLCRFIGDRRCGSPPNQLRKVLDHRSKAHGSQLDLTYGPVLLSQITDISESARDQIIQDFRASLPTS
ncbi:hypothetical protein G7Z17_g10647 [Cylindrodendrum hubeiense]|uniref:alpha-L-rhamnosidase n=1 Tax=Cylindrodendrum hubeiense TaxID=595255 RepID=A0A9P5LC44_9HYPO|nr:hypothetical protein G7Z17_g10647 [Cylindrodendrum hubeiense]